MLNIITCLGTFVDQAINGLVIKLISHHVIKFALENIYAGCSWTNDNLNQQNSNDLTIITVYIY